MTKPKLTYFDMAGSRGEECRLAFVLADVPFEDNRIKREEWMALKPNTPFGSLPLLEEEDKPVLSQSTAILTYLGLKHGLLPSDPWEQALTLAHLSAGEDLRADVGKTFGIKDAEMLKAARIALTEGPLTTWAKNTEAKIKGPFVSGAEPTVADIKIFVVAGWIEKGVLDHVPADLFKSYPKLQGLLAAFRAHPRVVAWYAR